MNQKGKEFRKPKLAEALMPLCVLIAALSVGILVYDQAPHIPMLIGTAAAAILALRLGYRWNRVEQMLVNGIVQALGAVIILLIIGLLIGIWVDAGVVPTMIYYGLKLLKPSFFLTAAVIICSVTSLATGSSWGTVGTIGVALMGVGSGLGINPALTAGAIVSGAYFGDKTSPMSDSTTLAAAVSGCNIITHIRFMLLPTGVAYGITLIAFTVLGLSSGGAAAADMGSVAALSDELDRLFTISPLLLLPILLVITLVALKVPALPGLAAGIVSGAVLGIILQQDCTLGSVMECGLYGYTCRSPLEAVSSLLTTGGIVNMGYTITMVLIAMMFSGIMSECGALTVIADALKKAFIKSPASLVALTETSCIVSNIVMPDQYIAIVVPGSMFQGEYGKMELAPQTLSNALDSAGAVTSALVPWNTCGVYVSGVLGIGVLSYMRFAVFNYTMPLVTLIMAFAGLTICGKNGKRMGAAARSRFVKAEQP